MTIKEFFESKKKLAIHCDTEEQTIALLKAFDREGFKWCDNTTYTSENNWAVYLGETCYSNNHGFGNRVFYQNFNYKILEFEEIEI